MSDAPELDPSPGAPDGCLGCSRLEMPDCPTVVLLSGHTVCSSCHLWLKETGARELEARYVLRMADRPTRIRHLEAREAKYGAEYRRRLEAVILQLWEARRAARMEEPS